MMTFRSLIPVSAGSADEAMRWRQCPHIPMCLDTIAFHPGNSWGSHSVAHQLPRIPVPHSCHLLEQLSVQGETPPCQT